MRLSLSQPDNRSVEDQTSPKWYIIKAQVPDIASLRRRRKGQVLTPTSPLTGRAMPMLGEWL
jgi:hypothetical protein